MYNGRETSQEPVNCDGPSFRNWRSDWLLKKQRLLLLQHHRLLLLLLLLQPTLPMLETASLLLRRGLQTPHTNRHLHPYHVLLRSSLYHQYQNLRLPRSGNQRLEN